MKIVFATNNQHKLSEVRAIVSSQYEILSLSEIGCYDEIPETADTLDGNALLKARWVKDKYGFDCFADDTGLEVTALGGAPGVYSARYAGEKANYTDNNLKLLGELSGNTNRTATFRTVICLIMKDKIYYFEGKIAGHISTAMKGNEGFGYDPLFVPVGFSESFAEMGTALKNTLSHRALAVSKLVKILQ
jgi:XTP/dITP diphosphohydrolase